MIIRVSRVLATIGRPLLLLVAMTLGSAGIATAADSIATAVGVKPQAQTLLGVENKVLVPNEALFEGQTISTGPYGQVQVLFADNTKMVVGPGSTLLIQKILMRNDGTASSFAVKALGGTYRFLTGNSKKQAYQINPPPAPSACAAPSSTSLLIRSRAKPGSSFSAARRSFAPRAMPASRSAKSAAWPRAQREKPICRTMTAWASARRAFPYVNGQQRLLRSFQVDDASECGQLVQQTFQSLSEPVTNPPAAVVPASTPDPQVPNTPPPQCPIVHSSEHCYCYPGSKPEPE